MALNLIALLALVCVTSVIAYLLYILGGLPGRIALQRRHRQAEAIRVMGWLGLLTGGIVWAVALVWAYMIPSPAPPASPSEEPECKPAS